MVLADLHCDLLCYLAGGSQRTPFDLQARCALPQLKQAGLKLQTLAIFSETKKHSALEGMAQVAAFQQLVQNYPDQVYAVKKNFSLERAQIGLTLAIENASTLCEEKEPLDLLFDRIAYIEKQVAKIAYISLTWNEENRFGGGAHAPGMLKSDGKRLLEYLNQKRIAVDLSHASDPLAEGILNELERAGYHIPVLASHSNFRAITPVARNLPDYLIKEIERRKGIIGFNFYKAFVGDHSRDFARHLEYALQHFSPEMLCLGADFFYDEDLPPQQRKRPDDLYFPETCHAGIAYSYVMDLWKRELGLTEPLRQGIAYRHLHAFLTTQILTG